MPKKTSNFSVVLRDGPAMPNGQIRFLRQRFPEISRKSISVKRSKKDVFSISHLASRTFHSHYLIIRNKNDVLWNFLPLCSPYSSLSVCYWNASMSTSPGEYTPVSLTFIAPQGLGSTENDSRCKNATLAALSRQQGFNGIKCTIVVATLFLCIHRIFH